MGTLADCSPSSSSAAARSSAVSRHPPPEAGNPDAQVNQLRYSRYYETPWTSDESIHLIDSRANVGQGKVYYDRCMFLGPWGAKQINPSDSVPQAVGTLTRCSVYNNPEWGSRQLADAYVKNDIILGSFEQGQAATDSEGRILDPATRYTHGYEVPA